VKNACSTGKVDLCEDWQDVSGRRLDRRSARRVAAIFRVLGNDTRLRLLHALARAPEVPVGTLCRTLHMKPQAISNQLRRLARLGIVSSRREGTTIQYRLIDHCVRGLLDHGLCLSETTRNTAVVPPHRNSRTRRSKP
jgi:ArsR family transcriptional regulator, lead/cadmium/zinc/bismuth-responsive transcriptional repressor